MTEPVLTKAYGYDTEIAIGRQVDAATLATAFTVIPFISSGFGKKRANEGDGLAGQGRDPRKVWPGIPDVSGDVRVALDLRYIGFFLTGLFGDPETTVNAGVYTHTFKSGKREFPVYSMQTAHKGPGKYDVAKTVVVNTMNLDVTNTAGRAGATFGLIGADLTEFTESQAGEAAVLTHAPCSNFNGKLKRGGQELGDVNTGSLTFSNNIEVFRDAGKGEVVAQYGYGETSTSGTLNSRFSNRALFDLANNGTPLDIEFSYELSASLKLVVTVHQAVLDLPAPAIDGPGGYGADFTFIGLRNAVAGCAITAVLINDQAATVYVPAE